MKKIFLSLSLVIFGLIAFAQAGSIEKLNTPVIKFENETLSYGTIEQGSNGVREFKFTNTGKSPLIIKESRTTCGCTVPTSPKEPIKPGESAVISVKYDTKRLGAFGKTVTIISNAKRPAITLFINGTVVNKTIEKPN